MKELMLTSSICLSIRDVAEALTLRLNNPEAKRPVHVLRVGDLLTNSTMLFCGDAAFRAFAQKVREYEAGLTPVVTCLYCGVELAANPDRNVCESLVCCELADMDQRADVLIDAAGDR